MKIIFSIILLLHICLNPPNIYAQIGAEAQGGKLAFWSAIGIDQGLSKKWLSITDIGYGRHSDNDNYKLFSNQGLLVFTQDFMYQINSHFKVTASAGYWKRNYYQTDLPEYRNELRPFTRLYYQHRLKNSLITHQLRNDFRFFYTPDYTKWKTPFEYRWRYMLAVNKALSKKNNTFIIVNNEILCSSAYNELSKEFGTMKLSENRFSFYFRYRLNKVDIDLGIMHQYYRQESTNEFTQSISLMIDCILRNTFSKKSKIEE